MPGPVIESSSSSGNIGSGVDCIITKPSGTVEGDLLVSIQFSGTASGRIFEVGSTGFTLDKWHVIDVEAVEQNTRIFYKVAGGSEPSSYTFPRNNEFAQGRGYMFRISGAEDPATIALVHSGNSNGSGGAGLFPDISPTDNDSLVLRSIGTYRGSGSATPPTGHNEELDEGDTDHSLATYSKTEDSGSTGTYTTAYLPTWHGTHHHTCVAIAPPSAGPSTLPKGVFNKPFAGPFRGAI